MRHLLVVILIASAMPAVCVGGRIVEIDLNEFCHRFETELGYPSLDTMYVQIPVDIGQIESVRVRYSCTANAGTIRCTEPEPHLEDWGFEVSAGIRDTDADVLWTKSVVFWGDGEFELESHDFQSFGSGADGSETLEFLVGASIRVVLQVYYAGYSPYCAFYDPYQELDLQAATLVLTVEDPTPVTEESWGSSKAMYR